LDYWAFEATRKEFTDHPKCIDHDKTHEKSSRGDQIPCFHVRGDTRNVCEKTVSIVGIAAVCGVRETSKCLQCVQAHCVRMMVYRFVIVVCI